MGGGEGNANNKVGLRGAKKAVVVAVWGGWQIANDAVGDGADKVLEGASECVNIGPRMGVDGGKALVKRVGVDRLQRTCGGGAWRWGLWMGREQLFMKRKELHEGGNGGGGLWAEGIDGEGIAEVSREGVDESCGKVGWG